jgi:hypothetical protein
MARIELRDTIIYIRDGLNGVATVNEATPASNDTDADILTPVLNTEDTALVPVGARFTVSTANNVTEYTVTARTPTDASPTTNIAFTPEWGDETPANADTLTFLPQQIEVKIGEGNLTYTESKEYDYLLDRGNLDTVREADQQPVDVSIDFVYEHVTSTTGEEPTVVEALKRIGGASEWVSASSDLCEPYGVDVVVDHITPCGSQENELTTLPTYRYESLEFDLSEATISTSGRCNVVEASVSRYT